MKKFATQKNTITKLFTRSALLLMILFVSIEASAQIPYYCDFDTNLGGFDGSGNNNSSNYFVSSGSTSTPGTFQVITNPNTMNTANFISTGGDHTTGSGKMMVVDGSNDASKKMWMSNNSNSITGLIVGAQYIFTYYIKNVNINPTSTPLASIQISKEDGSGTSAVQTNICPADNNWTKVTYTWTAVGTWVKFILFDTQTNGTGNDFALDDLSIIKVPPPLSLTYAAVNPTCPDGADGYIVGYAAGGTTPYTYTLNGSTSNSTGIFTGLSASTNTLSVTDANATPATITKTGITLTNPINALTVNATTSICSGASANLSASGGSSGIYTWSSSPADPTLAPTGDHPTANPTQTTTYTATTNSSTIKELISNGHFDSINTSASGVRFSSDYTNIQLNTSLAQQIYGIQPNPRTFESGFAICGDHTTGTGNMMVVDGSTVANDRVWYQTVPVLPLTTYTFSYYIQSVSASSPAQIETQVNGLPITGVAGTSRTTAPTGTCTWNQASYTWNSGAATTATIALIDRNTAAAGNDFALDDITFYTTSTCTLEKSITVNVSNAISPTISCGTSTTNSVQFTWPAVAGATGYTVSYQINSSSVVNAGAIGNVLVYNVTSLSAGDNVAITVTPTGASSCFTAGTQTCTAISCLAITAPTGAQSLCVGGDPTSLSVNTTFTGVNAISFVYFTTQQTGSNMYSGGTLLSNVTPVAGIASYNPPALGSSGSLPNTAATYYVYAIANPAPAGASCRPFQEIQVIVNAANTVTAASGSPSVCINNPITSVTHTTTGATGINTSTTGLPAGVTAAWSANTITISGTPTASGTFNYSIPLTGGCGSVNATGTITVTAANTVTAASGSPSVCINNPITSVTHTTTGATGINTTTTGLPAGVTAAWNANTITISGTPTASGTFNYSIPLTGGCGSVNATGTIIVTTANTVTAASSSPSVCINNPITSVTHTTTGATGINTTTTGLPAGVTASWSANTITISGTPTASGTFNYSIPLTGGCGSINATGTITVTTTNTVTAASGSPSVCINNPITSITHTTTGATGINTTTTGLPAGVTASWNANTITISGTPTASGTFNYSIPLAGGCGSANATGTITVTTANTVTIASGSPSVCINNPITSVTHTTTGATGINTTTTGLPAGVTAAWNANTITISGTPTASGTFNYSIPLTGGCGNINATGTITVTAANTVTAASSSPSVCINNPITSVTHTTTGATGINTTTTGLPAGVTASWNANTITVSGTPTASGTFNYSIPLTGGCGSVNATGTITVTTANTVTAASSSPSVCINNPITSVTHTTTGATGINTTTTGLPTGVTASWNANTITISGTPTASGTFNYSIPLTGGCGNINATGTITVTTTNTVTAASSSPFVCINNPITAVTHTTTGATGINTTTTGLPAGVTAAWSANTITISGTPTASGTFNYSIPLTGGCGSVNATGTITIRAANTVTAASGSPSVCINNPITSITHTTTGATGIGIATGLPASVSAGWAANTITISGTPTASGTFNYSIPLTGGCGNINATGTITVTTNNTITRTSAAATTNQPVCINSPITNITYSTTGATGATFAGLPTGVTGSWLANTVTISGTPSTTTGSPFSYTITLTGGCGSATATGTIAVKALPTATIKGSTTICPGTTTVISFSGTPNATVTYTINAGANQTITLDGAGSANITTPAINSTTTYDLVSVTSNGTPNCSQPVSGSAVVNTSSNITPKTVFSYTTPICSNAISASPTTEAGFNYGGIFSSTAGLSINSSTGVIDVAASTPNTYTVNYNIIANGCLTTGSHSSSITINPTTTPVTAFSYTPTAICLDGANPTLNPAAGFTTGGTYSATPVGLDINSSTGAINVATSLANAYTVKYSVAASGCQLSQDGTTNITINALPGAVSLSQVDPTCSAPTGKLTVTSSTAGLTFSNDGTNYTNTTGVFTGLTPGTTYNITSKNAAGCISAPNTKTIGNVPNAPAQPIVQVAQPTCISAIATIQVNPVIAGLTYTNNGVTNTTGTFPNIPAGASYSVTAQNSAGCTSAPQTGTVNPQPQTPAMPNVNVLQPTCTNITGEVTVTSTTTGLSFSNDGNNYSNTNGVFTGLAGGSAYSITARNSDGCTSAARTGNINPTPVTPIVSAGLDKQIFLGQTVQLDGSVQGGNNVSIVWTPNIFITNSTSPTPLVSPTTDRTYTITATSIEGCHDEDEVDVKILKEVIIPNVFSPNGDSKNDTWKITNIEDYPNATVDVFNRYGQFIFGSVGYTIRWDGTFKGSPVPVGAYYYIIKLRSDWQPLKGVISVIR